MSRGVLPVALLQISGDGKKYRRKQEIALRLQPIEKTAIKPYLTTLSAPTASSLNQVRLLLHITMSKEGKLLPSVYKPSAAAPTNSPGQSDAPKFVPPASSHWPYSNFVLAAGTATFQLSTAKVVLIEDRARRPADKPREKWCWFLPRGRKDRGETLEQCAVRETLEEVNNIKSWFCLHCLHYLGRVRCNSHALANTYSSAPTCRSCNNP